MKRIAVDGLTRMPVLALILIAIVVAGAGAARADNFTAGTSGVFTSAGATSGNGTNTVTWGTTNSLTLTFNGAGSSTYNTPTNWNFGDILASTTGTGATISSPTTLTITVTQTAPTNGSGTLTGSLSGTVQLNQSGGQLVFTTSSITIGGFTYVLPGTYLIVPPTSGGGGGAVAGDTTIQGTVTGSTVPEPGSLALLGSGLVGLAGIVRRRRIL